MKKLYLLVIIAIFVFLIYSEGKNSFVLKNFVVGCNDKTERAVSAFYDFLEEDVKNYPFEDEKRAKNFFVIDKNSLSAFCYDLNSDKVDEIVGVVQGQPYSGISGCRLFVLQKKNNKFDQIYSENFPLNLTEITVTKDSTKGYYDLKVKTVEDKTGIVRIKN